MGECPLIPVGANLSFPSGARLQVVACLAWEYATLPGGQEFCQILLEQISVDLDTRNITAVKPRATFRELMAQTANAPLMLWSGDPERIRTADLHLDRVAC